MAKVFSVVRSPFFFPRRATALRDDDDGYGVGDANGNAEWYEKHTTWKRFAKRAIDKSFEGKRAALPLFLPFLFSARCLPYGRFDLYIGVDYN